MSNPTATGHRASGDYASGHRASGDYASGHRASGYFQTEDAPVTFFDKPVPGMTHAGAQALIPCINLPLTEWIPAEDMTATQKAAKPSHTTTGGFLLTRTYHEAWAIWWAAATDAEKQQFLSLPNFDAAKFAIIIGIDVTAPAEYITLGDRRYPKAEVEAALAGIKSEVAK